LDVVTDNRQAGVGELLGPDRVRGDEDRQGVDERATGVDGRLGVEAVRLLRTHREVGDDHVDLGLAERLHHIDSGLIRLLDGLAVVVPPAVVGRTALDEYASRRYVANLDRVVLAGEDRLREIHAHLLGVNVERRDEFHVRDVVAAEVDVHQTRNAVVRVGVAVVLNALNQRRCAVPDTDDGDAYGAHSVCLLLVDHGRSGSSLDCPGGGGFSSSCWGTPRRSGVRPERSLAMSSSSQRTSRSQASRPCRCSSRVYASSRSAARLSSSRNPSLRSSTFRRRPSRIRSRVARSVRAKKAKCTPNPASSYVSGPAWAITSPNRSFPSAVIL